jgi:hypothetical protein
VARELFFTFTFRPRQAVGTGLVITQSEEREIESATVQTWLIGLGWAR